MNNHNFSFQSEVVVKKGFYKGFRGIITDFKESKEGILYKVKLNSEHNVSEQWFKSSELKKHYKFFRL